ncbi:class I SAM-dependent methyltransferase [Candidatus Entotheonella palauensis]|uniref:class I SAM-dependent methyltransferase n=1 Tax=Candidatus Entotheonella palauensis TaxID=93172 RepID=UPI000B7CF757|nr:SAM-dependent methyltransferase [Candidatus Entotheonella palauensis]
MHSSVDQEIRELIQKHGRLTFAQFMQTCLYSPRGGFYASRGNSIRTHFGTSPTSHPVFGALIARQLEQMWNLLGAPPIFHVIEVGAGDGALAQSIVQACWQMAPQLAQALCYVAADYEPRSLPSPVYTFDWDIGTRAGMSPSWQDAGLGVRRVKTEGIRAFRNVVGCILCNELIDNFPVHRFAIRDGRVQEVFVTSAGGHLTEVLDEPSSPRIEERLTDLGVSLPEGYRGEVNLAIEDWTGQLASALDRGFILTIDYGHLATELYSPRHHQGTLVCYHRHAVSSDPYQHIGQQDITCQVDFTSLIQLGQRHGLATVGYALQSQFLTNLGFSSFLDKLESQRLSAARMELSRMALMTLVAPEEYGDFKVLAQVKGNGSGIGLLGFESQGT